MERAGGPGHASCRVRDCIDSGCPAPAAADPSLPAGSGDLLTGKLAVLGAGKMGGILIAAFLRSGLFTPERITATVAHADRASTLQTRLGVHCLTDNQAAASGARVILLGVKPTQVLDLVRSIQGHLGPETVLISIAASVTTASIEAAAGCDTRFVAD